jgi:hypothetical protein
VTVFSSALAARLHVGGCVSDQPYSRKVLNQPRWPGGAKKQECSRQCSPHATSALRGAPPCMNFFPERCKGAPQCELLVTLQTTVKRLDAAGTLQTRTAENAKNAIEKRENRPPEMHDSQGF